MNKQCYLSRVVAVRIAKPPMPLESKIAMNPPQNTLKAAKPTKSPLMRSVGRPRLSRKRLAVAAYYAATTSMADAARIAGVSLPSLHAHCRAIGMAIPGRGRPAGQSSTSRSALAYADVAAGTSQADAARKHGISHQAIQQFRKKLAASK